MGKNYYTHQELVGGEPRTVVSMILHQNPKLRKNGNNHLFIVDHNYLC